MKYYLAKFEDNCADEFDVYGFAVLNEEEYNNYMNICKECEELEGAGKLSDFDDFEIGCGTNESIYYDNVSEFILSPTITEITESQYRTFIDLDMECYGFDFWDRIIEVYEDYIEPKVTK
jgi:hypothetical protein